MSKLFKAILSLFFLSFFSFSMLQAATYTWLGGTGKWDNPAKWDFGVVPTSSDDVIIPVGSAKVTNGTIAYAKSILVNTDGRLYVFKTGELHISGAKNKSGLYNDGKVYLIGKLFIDDVGSTDSSYYISGIENNSKIYAYPNSVITIDAVDNIGIYNNLTGFFSAQGEINISGFENQGIYNRDRFFNTGSINVNNPSNASAFGIISYDDFRNNLGGNISINGDMGTGISNNASFRNNGSIEIEHASVGFGNNGALVNVADATIYTEYTTQIGFKNTSAGILTNYGEIIASDSEAIGLSNSGVIENYDKIHFNNSQSIAGVYNYPGGYISNFSHFAISSTYSKDLINAGLFYSHLGAYFSVDKQIDIESTGTFSNSGFMPSFYDGQHSVDAGGTFYNSGVIDDDFNSTDGAVTNLKVIVGRVAGTMTEGVPFPNVLEVVSATGLDFQTWYTAPTGLGGIPAGTYNEATNEFTPNSAAVGLSTLYVHIEDVISGNGRLFSLEIDGGIVAFQGKDTPLFFQNNESDNSVAEENLVTIFPNPTNGTIQIKSEAFENVATQVEVFNSLGQLVQQVAISKGDRSQQINFSDQLTNGLYFIKINQNGQLVNTERIYLQR